MSAEIVREWLYQVERDLLSAHNCAHATDPTPDRAAFFVQQAAEKLVKAVLIAHGTHARYTHDIGDLAALVPEGFPGRERLLELRRFTRFVVVFRYPTEHGIELMPSADEIDAWSDEIAALKRAFEGWLAARTGRDGAR